MASPIVHFEICVTDLEKSRDFYANIFGWDMKFDSGMDYVEISTGSEPGGGIFRTKGEMKPYVTVYMKVDDINATIEKAKQNGAFIIAEKTKISDEHGYYGMFADADNNVIGVWSSA